MAFSLGALIVDLEARTGKFETDMGRAAGIMKKRTAEIDRQVAALGRSFVIMATGAAVAIGALITRSIKAADETLELAQALGTTVEQFSALRYSASLAGVSQEELETALRKLSSTAVDAGSGLKSAEKAFKALGVEVTDASGQMKSVDALIGEIASAFAAAPDGIIKTSVATDLFGRAGAKLIPLLNEGSEGLEKMRQEAESLGLVLSTEAAQAADQFNDNLLKLKGITSGFGNLLVQELIGPLGALVEHLGNTATGSDKLKAAAQGVASVLKGIAATVLVLGATFLSAGKNLGAFAAAFVQFKRMRFDLVFEIIKERSSEQIGEFDSVLKTIETLFDEPAASVAAQAPAIAKQLALPVTQAAKLSKEAVAEMERFLNQANQMNIDRSQLAQPLVQGSVSGAELPGLGNLNDMVEDVELKTSEMTQTFKVAFNDMSVFADQAARNMQDAFAQFLFDPFKDGLKGMLRGFVDILRKMVAEMAASQIFQAIGGALSGSTNPFFAALGKAFSGERAGGGPVMSGRSYLVGERGPELFNPSSSGSIVPNNALGGLTLAPVYNINIDSRSDRAAIQQDMIAIVTEGHKRLVRDLDRRSGR